MSRDGMRVELSELTDWAVEALKRSGYDTSPMHPEDWAAAITPAIEAVALGYGEGYRRGLADERKRQG